MELSSGGVLVEVRDDGVGVSPNRLADMNWRLDHPPVVDVSISRHMGLYAVSRLAARHGIRVKLRPGAPQGLSALVWLPGTLAKREPTPAGGGQTRSYGMDTTGPVPGIRTAAAPPRPVTGRHRGGLAVRAEQPLPAGQGAQPERPAAWFAAKRPSSGAAVPEEELATGWQTATGWQAAANWQAGANRNATPDGGPLSEPAERTSSGLPRRVPRTSAYPGSDTPGSGMPSMPGSPLPATAPANMGAADMGAPVLGAPPGGTGSQGQPYREAPYLEQVPSRRRSPEAARSRLAGFQLGSRDAVQAGHGTGWKPFAGEENRR
jgi:hypothetical protein